MAQLLMMMHGGATGAVPSFTMEGRPSFGSLPNGTMRSPEMNGQIPSPGRFLGFGGPAGLTTPRGLNVMTPPSNSSPLSALSSNREERIRQIVDAAKRTHPNRPHLAKLAAAQALLESGIHSSRVSGLARSHNNLFGIKGRGTAGTVNLRTREVLGGRSVHIRDGFAKNNTIEDSFQQHSRLLTRNSRYRGVLNANSFEEAADQVRRAGYATAPNYTTSLIAVYNRHLRRHFE